ncbi:hypothetical protein HMPREF1316_0246 [Olsenella profusa F0195]|uniref:Uncharacterized protein n=1 Tax=Olsenella profusa F0195 TaxID=1125712 RepID=U2TQ23_9ACTN|nr:hypothetical protein HMPREF1316_0246 [Olsenella profusa F0195]
MVLIHSTSLFVTRLHMTIRHVDSFSLGRTLKTAEHPRV